MRIFFTGGSGKAGRHAVRHLVERGHHVVNGDLVPLAHAAVADLRIDLTDAGQVFNALSAYAGFDELEPGTGVPPTTPSSTSRRYQRFSSDPTTRPFGSTSSARTTSSTLR